MVVSRIGRRPTLLIVSVLCVLQSIWVLHHERDALDWVSLSAALLGVVLFLLIFQDMYRHGYRLARRSRQPAEKRPLKSP